MAPPSSPMNAEWLEPDGLGGFASGTVSGIRTRRYHALLLTATTPPTGRMVLVNGFEAWLTTPAGRFPLSSQAYQPDVIHPDGARGIDRFEFDSWPRWTFQLPDGTRIVQEILVPKGVPAVAVSFKIDGALPASARLEVRPLISGRDYHSMHHENSSFRFDPERGDELLIWRPYEGVPGIISLSDGDYTHDPVWYRGFHYSEESARGLDGLEDLASPGTLSWDLTRGESAWILGAEPASQASFGDRSARALLEAWRRSETGRRGGLKNRLDRAADIFLVDRGGGRTIVAGYPWFTDWGRDTFIALRGLCLATGRLDEARSILLEWAGAVSEGMLPNLFPDGKATPEYNSVDASLWYIIAVHDYLHAAKDAGRAATPKDRAVLRDAVEAILEGYARGTRFGIRADEDGLLAAGVPGVQLTWMDAKVGDWVVTPRIGKPVEVQALWLNALASASGYSGRWRTMLDRGRAAFAGRFWNDEGGYLHDVVDVDHVPGRVDASFRPNQILAVGGLPLALLEGDRARVVVDAVERRLLTPLGLRSLAPGEPGYAGRYAGGPRERDGAYHQGTAWPWLIGPFADAWIRVHGGSRAARAEARERFLAPLIRHLGDAGLQSISEIADGDPPHTPRGCPFQAWSVGEVLRLERVILAETIVKKETR